MNPPLLLLFTSMAAVTFAAEAPQSSPADLGKPSPSVEVVAAISPPDPDPSGIAVSRDHRVFLGFPRHADNHDRFALAELVNGRLEPFPNRDFVYPSDKPYAEWLVSPHGMVFDDDDVLWIIDDGKRAGIAEIPPGAAKLVGIDIQKREVIASIPISPTAMGSDSHLNDLRVDRNHGEKGTAYITNSGFGSRYSLVVVDIASGRAREVLKNVPCTSPEPGFMAFLEGQPKVFSLKNPSFPIGGADGIALSADRETVYWTALSARNLYSLPTAVLSDFSKSDAEILASVKFEGERPACDGLAEDSEGNVYFGAFEPLSLVKRAPGGTYSLLVHDPRLGWPDGLCYRDGWLYVTLGQWNRLPAFNNGKELRKPPFLLVRTKVR